MDGYSEKTQAFIEAVKEINTYGKDLPERVYRLRTPRTPDHYYNRRNRRGRFNTLVVPDRIEEAVLTVYESFEESLEECMLDSTTFFRRAFIRLPVAFGELEEITFFKLRKNLRYRVLQIGKFELIVRDDVYDSAECFDLMAA